MLKLKFIVNVKYLVNAFYLEYTVNRQGFCESFNCWLGDTLPVNCLCHLSQGSVSEQLSQEKLDGKYSERVQLPAKVCWQHLPRLLNSWNSSSSSEFQLIQCLRYGRLKKY